MDLKIEPEAMKAIITDALLRQLDAGARETLIRGAIAYLMTPIKSTWDSSNRTPMESAFNEATRDAARDIIREEMTKPEVRAIVAEAVTKAFTKALQNEDGMVEEMAKSIQSAIRFKER